MCLIGTSCSLVVGYPLLSELTPSTSAATGQKSLPLIFQSSSIRHRELWIIQVCCNNPEFLFFSFLFFWNQLGALAHRLRRRWDTGASRRRTRVGCLSPSWTNQAPARSSNLAENSENSSPLYETSFIPGRLLNDATKPLVYSAAPTSGGTRPGG